MAKLPEYNSAFLRLFLMYGNVGNKELLRLYFTKLPSPWGQDTIGLRMALVEKKLEDYCLDWRMRKNLLSLNSSKRRKARNTKRKQSIVASVSLVEKLAKMPINAPTREKWPIRSNLSKKNTKHSYSMSTKQMLIASTNS